MRSILYKIISYEKYVAMCRSFISHGHIRIWWRFGSQFMIDHDSPEKFMERAITIEREEDEY